jgi:hypothetical protein
MSNLCWSYAISPYFGTWEFTYTYEALSLTGQTLSGGTQIKYNFHKQSTNNPNENPDSV